MQPRGMEVWWLRTSAMQRYNRELWHPKQAHKVSELSRNRSLTPSLSNVPPVPSHNLYIFFHPHFKWTDTSINEFLVSKETVVLHQCEGSKQKFDFIKQVDKSWITTVKDLESVSSVSPVLYSLWRRANAQNVSFLNLPRWKFNLYQLVWSNQIFVLTPQ